MTTAQRLSLRSLLNVPEARQIGSCQFLVSKLGTEDFDDALLVGPWLQSLDESRPIAPQLEAIKPGSPVAEALHRMLARSLVITAQGGAGLPDDAEQMQLTVRDVQDMPLVMQAEALAVVMEVNADFFFRTIATLARTAHQLGWTGSALHNSSSAQDTSPLPSGDTPSPSSRVS